MKKIMLAIFFCLPMCTFAEKRFSFGVYAGTAPYSLPLNNKSDFNGAYTGEKIYLHLGADITYTFKEKYQIGLQTSLTGINYIVNSNKLFYAYSNPKYKKYYNDAIETCSVFPVEVTFNKILNFDAISCYEGVAGGYEQFLTGNKEGTTTSGLLLDAHFGILFNQAHAVKLNVNIAVDYHYTYNNGIHYKIFTYPITVGLVF